MGRFVPSMAARSVVAAVLLACAIALAFDGSLDETTDLGETHEVANIGADDTLSIMLRNEQEDEESDDDELGETKATVGRALKDAGETNDRRSVRVLMALCSLSSKSRTHMRAKSSNKATNQPRMSQVRMRTKSSHKATNQPRMRTKSSHKATNQPRMSQVRMRTKSSHKATNQPRMRTK